MRFIRSFLLILLVLIAHAIGSAGLYWAFRWFDAPVHFLGGLAAGALALDIWYFAIRKIELRHTWLRVWMLRFVFVLGVTSIIGIIWELHEYMLDILNGISIARQASLRDTMGDFVMDLVGGTVAYVIFAGTYKKD